MATPTLSQSAKADASNGTSQTLTLSSGPTQANLLIAAVYYSQYGGARTISTPTGWTKLCDISYGNDSLAVFSRRAGASEPASVTFSISGGAEWHSGAIFELAGAFSVAVYSATNTNTVSATGLAATSYLLATFGIDGNAAAPTFTNSFSLLEASSQANYHNHATGSKSGASSSESTAVSWGTVPVAALIVANDLTGILPATETDAAVGLDLPSRARVSQDVVEALTQAASTARVSQEAVEALTTTTAAARVSQIVFEILRTIHTFTVEPARETDAAQPLSWQVISPEQVLTPATEHDTAVRFGRTALEAALEQDASVQLLYLGPGAWLTQAALEVTSTSGSDEVLMTQAVIEVLRQYGHNLSVWWRF